MTNLPDDPHELVEYWRRTARYDDVASAPGHQVQVRCANELERVLDSAAGDNTEET